VLADDASAADMHRLAMLEACSHPALLLQHPVTGQLITDYKQIAARYTKSWFWIDFLATFPSDYIVKGLEVCCKSTVLDIVLSRCTGLEGGWCGHLTVPHLTMWYACCHTLSAWLMPAGYLGVLLPQQL
jgi:hypothetical protein